MLGLWRKGKFVTVPKEAALTFLLELAMAETLYFDMAALTSTLLMHRKWAAATEDLAVLGRDWVPGVKYVLKARKEFGMRTVELADRARYEWRP